MDEISAQRKADALRVQAATRREEAEQLEREAALWAQGAEGERITAAALAALCPEAAVLHDRLLEPGVSEVNLDHVVVSGAGVFLIDSKYWSGDVSVYEANLWQHLGGGASRQHRPKHLELDKVSRAAARVERALSGPVVPVLCLAAPHHAGVEHQRVRGVDVVPAGALAAWVRAQPAWLTPTQVESTTRRVANAFPPAGSAVPGASPPPGETAYTSALGPVRPSPGRRTSSRPRRPRKGQRPSSPPRAPRPQSPGRRPGRSLLTAALGLLALWLLATQLPRIAPALGAVVGRELQVTPPTPATPTAKPVPAGTPTAPIHTLLDGSPAPVRPCEGITSQQVAAAVARDVVPHAATSHDMCGWHLEAQTNPYVPPDLTVTTGYLAKVAIQSRGLTTVSSSAATGTASVLVPQFMADPTWNVAPTAVTQPFHVSYRYSYPAKPTQATITATDAAALATVTTLARDLAGRLPQGPGADDTTFRF